MKKILHITHTDIQTDSRILKEMESLAKVGYELNGLGIQLEEGAAKTNLAFNAKIEALKLHSRQFKFMPRTLRHTISLFELLLKILPRAVKLKPDVVHCHDTLVLPLGMLIKIITGAKLIYDAHELESDRNGITKLQGKLTLYVEKFLWNLVDGLIVVSPSIEKWYLDNIGFKKSAVVLNSPLFDGVNKSKQNYLREKFKIRSDELIFIYIGILGVGRGLDNLIQAFSNKNVKSHIVFLGFGDYSERLKKLADEKSNFHFHEAVPHSQVVPIAMSANYGLCLIEKISLSDYLCLPNKLFEYCFAGLPILASNFPDIRKIIEEYSVGECCEIDVLSIIDAVKKMEISSDKYFTKNLEFLSWQEQEKNLIDLYNKII
jgi:glycosyltransferase involved in cell wall biosynthesis